MAFEERDDATGRRERPYSAVCSVAVTEMPQNAASLGRRISTHNRHAIGYERTRFRALRARFVRAAVR